MASITVRNLEDGLKRRLRIRAAENGRSMEQETRDILWRRACSRGYLLPGSACLEQVADASPHCNAIML